MFHVLIILLVLIILMLKLDGSILPWPLVIMAGFLALSSLISLVVGEDDE